MKTIIETDKWDSALQQWRGGSVVVWMYHATQRRLALRLSGSEASDDLYIVAVRCRQIQGPLAWNPSDVKILPADEGREAGGEDEFLIVDEAAGFRLICVDVALARGPSTDYDVTFEGFLGDSGEGS